MIQVAPTAAAMPARTERRRREADVRGWIIGGAVVLAGAAGITDGVVLPSATGDEAVADDRRQPTPPSWSTVEQRDLARTEELDGTVGHGDADPLVLAGDGTLTGLPAAGDIVAAGHVSSPRSTARRDRPARARPDVAGARARRRRRRGRPASSSTRWPTSATPRSTTSRRRGVDERDDRAVKAFQEDHGQDDDGTVDLGEIVWSTGPVRIDSVGGTVGQQAAEAGIEVTGAEPVRRTSTPTSPTPTCSPSATRSTSSCRPARWSPATVTTVGAPRPTRTATRRCRSRSRWPAGRRAPTACRSTSHVDVVVGRGRRWPCRSRPLLALAEGGYAVEVGLAATGRPASSASSSACSPTSYVEVTGDVAAGDEVVVP